MCHRYGSSTRKGRQMYSNSDLGRFQRQDRLRQAEAYRRAAQASGALAAERRATVRRVLGTAISLLLWPIRH
jgi:hypothetical protein